MTFTRFRASRAALTTTFVLMLSLAFSLFLPAINYQHASGQSVEWLSDDSVSYLSSSGVPVMVPSWVPGPVAGSTPEIYAGGGSYSIYFYFSGTTFLYITGVAGGGFPGGSEANLNVELSVNASVQGYPAIHDVGIPEGSDTPIYDKVMWIADGVFYTISGNGLDTDSLTLANSAIALYADAPVATELPPESDLGVDTSEQTVANNAENVTTDDDPAENADAPDESTDATESSDSTTSESDNISDNNAAESSESNSAPQPTNVSSDGTGGAWFVGMEVNDDASDGTAGPPPPILDDDGTGGP